MLDRLISVYRTEQRTGGQRGLDEGGASRAGDYERQTHDPPQMFRFADPRRFEMHSGQATTIYLLTDGPDNLLSRRQRGGRINLACEGDEVASFGVGSMQNGRIAVHVYTPTTVPSGRRARIVATLQVDPATFLTDSRDLRIVPQPPPYVGTEPPTGFDFASNKPLPIELGRRSRAEIHTDARNDILDRPINPATVQVACDIPGVYLAIRGPKDGVATTELHAGSGAILGTEGMVTAILTFEDGTTFTTSRPCEIVPVREHEPRSGVRPIQVPAYQIIRVWRVAPDSEPDAWTWTAFSNPWNAERVGRWEMNGDELHLYVNMDEHQFLTERSRLIHRFGDSHAARLTDRHVAYLAFHLFQLHEQNESRNSRRQESQLGEARNSEEEIASEDSAPGDTDSTAVNQELLRVTATLIQTLRSEGELMRLEAETDD